MVDSSKILNRRQTLGVLSMGAALGWYARLNLAQAPAARARTTNLVTPEVSRSIARGLAFLRERQNEDGSFGTGAYGRNVAVASLCAMAFLSNGSSPGRGRYGGIINRALAFVQGRSSESGFINSKESTNRGPMYGHGFSTLLLAEVYGMSLHPQLREQLSRATALIVVTQNEAGGWRYQPRRDEADLSVTVCQLMALRAARNAGVFVPNATVDQAVDYIKRCQNPDGGFSYRVVDPGESAFPRSAAAIVALYSAGVYGGEEIRHALDYLMQFPPTPETFGGPSYYFYGQYYAIQSMWHARGDYWNAWYPAIRDVLQVMQEKNGSWPASISREFGTAMACLILQMPQNYLPIFQR